MAIIIPSDGRVSGTPARHDSAGRHRNQAHDGLGRDTFPAPGLADHAEHFSFVEKKGDIVHGFCDAFKGVEISFQFLNLQ
jgi:hypothetical protein